METLEIVVAVHSRRPPEKGQAPRRMSLCKRFAWLDRRTVVRYVLLAAAGVLLYRLGAACALLERGYFAVGGEAVALFLPVLYYLAAATVRDWLDRRGGCRKKKIPARQRDRLVRPP